MKFSMNINKDEELVEQSITFSFLIMVESDLYNITHKLHHYFDFK